MNRRLAWSIGAVFIALATGCASVPVEQEGWVYSGSDPLLRFPETRPLRGTPAETRLQAIEDHERFDAWRRRALDAIAATKIRCADQTGDPAVRTFWRGYSAALLACMQANGWSRDRSTNPL
jgi:hypothetical protein